MARLTSGFFDSINKDRGYTADQFGRIFDGIINDGIFHNIPDGLKVIPAESSAENLKVIVSRGRAWFNGTWTYIEGNDYEINLEMPEVTESRYDAIYLVINKSVQSQEFGRKNYIFYKKGSNYTDIKPEPPVITEDDDRDLYKAMQDSMAFVYPLAYIVIPPKATEITEEMIEDQRGTDLCPFATILTGTDDKAGQNEGKPVAAMFSNFGNIGAFKFVEEEPITEEMQKNTIYFIVDKEIT